MDVWLVRSVQGEVYARLATLPAYPPSGVHPRTPGTEPSDELLVEGNVLNAPRIT